MKRYGTKRGRALLVDSELDIRRTISRYLQLHGMDVVEVNTLHEATGRLAGPEDFDLLVADKVDDIVPILRKAAEAVPDALMTTAVPDELL